MAKSRYYTEGLARIFRPQEMGAAQAAAQIIQGQPLSRFLEKVPAGTAQLSQLTTDVVGPAITDLYKMTPSARDARQSMLAGGLFSKAVHGAARATAAENKALADVGQSVENIRRQQERGFSSPPGTAIPAAFRMGLSASLAQAPQQRFGPVAPSGQLRAPAVSQEQIAQALQGFTDPSRRAIISDDQLVEMKERVKEGLKPVDIPETFAHLTKRPDMTDEQLAGIFQAAKDKRPIVLPTDFDDPGASLTPGRVPQFGKEGDLIPGSKAFLGTDALLAKNILHRDPGTGRLVIADLDKLQNKIDKGRISPFAQDRYLAMSHRDHNANPIVAQRASLSSLMPPPSGRSSKGFMTTKQLLDKGLLLKTADGRLTTNPATFAKLQNRTRKGRIQPSTISRLV